MPRISAPQNPALFEGGVRVRMAGYSVSDLASTSLMNWKLMPARSSFAISLGVGEYIAGTLGPPAARLSKRLLRSFHLQGTISVPLSPRVRTRSVLL